jgi:dihydroorotase (multifunctional complex type)
MGNETPRAEILVTDGLIEEVLEDNSQTAVGGEQWVDLNDALVLPGLIDGHVDLADPGFPLRGDFSSGTAAAAAGGVTCIVDLPCSSDPPVTTEESLDFKARVVSSKAHVDFMLWGGISGNTYELGDWKKTLLGFVESGVAAIHLSMRSDLSDCRELDFEQMAEVTQEAWRLGIPVGLHAEAPDPIRAAIRERRDMGTDGPSAWSGAHPTDSEYSAIAVARELCRSTGVKLHLLGVASGDGLDLVLEGRQEGLPLSAGTCPAYLEFCTDDFHRKGSVLKLSPALKAMEDRYRLWQGLRDSSIQFVNSGHVATQWPEEKNTGSIWTDRSGFPGIQSTLPYLYSEGVSTGRISLERMIELISSGPARFFGIDHLKGALKPGMHADFVVFDDNQSWEIRASTIHGLNRFTPFEGARWTGRVRATYVRGNCVYRLSPDGREMFGTPGSGQWVTRGQQR